MHEITLPDYRISIGASLPSWKDIRPDENISKVFILVDNNTKVHCLPLIPGDWPSATVIEISEGEQNKILNTCSLIWEKLLENNADRSSLLINLGGGVIGDMGGFVASTYKRGIRFINLPTTLLSQVDASVGGKLGIDFNGLKNVIGIFNNPKHIAISSDFLKTLPKEQIRSGFAEILKHALISDNQYWKDLKTCQPGTHESWEEIIHTSVLIKRDVVEQDPFEKGRRKILNFGHTIGHAIETLSLNNDKKPLLHGEAIAIGMICEAWLSNKYSGLPGAELNEISETISSIYPAYAITNQSFDSLMALMYQDKKNESGNIMFSLLRKIGDCGFNDEVSIADIQSSINYYMSL